MQTRTLTCNRPHQFGVHVYAGTHAHVVKPGTIVIVHPDGVDVPERARTCRPAWRGEVVAYWRNGAWTVREPDCGTTCAYDERRLEVVPPGSVRWFDLVDGNPVRG